MAEKTAGEIQHIPRTSSEQAKKSPENQAQVPSCANFSQCK